MTNRLHYLQPPEVTHTSIWDNKSEDHQVTESIGEYGRGDATPSWLLNGYSLQLYSEYTLTLKIGVCVVTAEALGVLAHVTAFRARLGRRDQPGERALLATDGSL